MSDPTDEGPDGTPEGPLSDTFPEFVRYARNRRKKGPRQAPPRPFAGNGVRSPATVRQAALAAGTVVAFFLVLAAERAFFGSGPARTEGPAAKGRVSAWIDLPRPARMGEVPDGWGRAKLGMRLQDVPSAQRVPYTGGDLFADVVFTPDPARPDNWFGLSFYHERLYRIAVRYGEDSQIPTMTYLGPAGIAYGKARGYEYPTSSARHVVTIFQSETRALKLDSAKVGDALNLAEIVLVDLEQGAARELARARGQR